MCLTDRQSIRQDHLYKSKHPNILTLSRRGRGWWWVKEVEKLHKTEPKGEGIGLKGWQKLHQTEPKYQNAL